MNGAFTPSCTPFDRLRANGMGSAEPVDDPFVVSLSMIRSW